MTVWYAAYGSNLSRERFDCYLRGGCPDGASHTHPGCRDATPPAEDVACEIGLALAFGGTSRTWGGGVALVRPGGVARARLYRISSEQFEDVVAQENRLQPGSLRIELAGSEVVLDGDHSYRVVIPLGERDGAPVVTVSQPADTALAAPTLAYLRHVAAGLRESYPMSDDEICAYLAAAAVLEASDIADALSEDAAP